MSETSARLALPFLQPSQAQKHVTHNEALQRLDTLVQLAVTAFGAETPPPLPEEGAVWALGAAPGGDWVGQGNRLAAWINGGWEFVQPQPGWLATGLADGSLRRWTGSNWVQPALDLQNLPGIGINTSHDATNRLAVAATATLLTHEGEGHQITVNKAATTETASLLFQTDWSGRAEMGTAGSDDFAIKTSPDGMSWHTGMAIAAATGAVSLPNGLSVQGPVALPDGSVTRAMLGDAPALSVPGRAGDSEGPLADLAAGADHQVLRRSGTTLGFGALALDQSAAVSGQLSLANGGTGAATAGDARANLGLGSAATADVASDPADTTAGVLLANGTGPAQAYRQGNILGTVSQSGGVPTGAVVERGSNANGSFVRFADGTQICWRSLTLGSVIASGSGTLADPYRTTPPATWTFPAAFSTVPAVTATPLFAAGPVPDRAVFGRCGVPTTTTAPGIHAFRTTSINSDLAIDASLVAIGRWF